MKFEHVALQVAEPAAVADWYVEHLGMKIVRSGGPPGHARFIADATGRTVLEIYRNPNHPVPDYASASPVLLHVAFAVENLEAERARLVSAGATIELEFETNPLGDAMCMLRDPWGLPLQLVQRTKPMP